MDKKFLKIKDSYITNKLSNFPSLILITENEDYYLSRQYASPGGGWSFDIKKLTDKERNNIKHDIDSELLDELKFKFKKCPYCGSFDIKFVSELENTTNIPDYEFCVCINCDAEGPKSITQIYKNADNAKHEAKFKWNKRA